MKKIFAILILTSLVSCKKDFLDVSPKGLLSETQVAGSTEELVTAAYASLNNDGFITPLSLWPYGNVRSGDAYKGGRDEADIQEFYFFETFKFVRSDLGPIDGLWFQYYLGISRANAALIVLNALPDTNPLKATRTAEVRFLRAHWFFQLKILFKYFPYIDETVNTNDYGTISNRALSSDQLWEKIVADFQFAVDHLPEVQPQKGRINKAAATAYLAKTRLYQAYTQDEQHNVAGISADKLNQVVTLCNQVLSSGGSLETDFANNFRLETENGNEAIFAVQYVKDAVTEFGRLNFGDELSAPQGIGCCDFHKPSQNLVNSYKTGADGLPLLSDFNKTDLDLNVNTVDPRLNHTVAMPGHPWKYTTGEIYQQNWNRTPDTYGYYASLKENVRRNQYIQNGPFYANPKNRIIIRYADVILWKAEALIELGRQDEALPLINEIRTRAKNSTGLLKLSNGNFESNFNVDTYKPGINCTWTKSFAREALRFERRLEFAMEGTRFFDLVRWGIADSYLNAYFTTEKTKRAYLKDGLFKKNRDEYLPIPLNQIRFSKGLYVQNNGYVQ